MPQPPRTLVGALCVALLFPTLAIANGNVKVSRFWHNHQPIYWPEWNGDWNDQPNRVQFARDSIELKGGQLYDSGVAHPENDLVQIFGVDDRKKAYQEGPKNSLDQVNQSGGYAMSYSGSLIDNVASLGRVNYGGYGSNWWDGNRTARTWLTPGGSSRMELVGFTYHHSLGPVLPKAVFRKELQIFHEAAYKAWNTGSATNRSRGFFPTEMAFSRHMIDVLADEGYQWVIVPSHHLSRTLPSYMGSSYTSPEANSWKIYSSPPNKADQINAVSGGGWWFGTGNVGETAYNHAPFAYQLHKAKYVNPETGAEKTIIMVPSDDIQSYKAGYSGWQKGLIDANISPHANDSGRPCIIMPATDGDNAWGGGSSSWDGDAPGLMNNGTYPGVAVQDFVNQFGGAADTVHVEDGAWIFPESCYGSPNFLKWVEPPANPNSTNRVFNTQVDMETPGFTPKFYSWAPIISGANWCETAEQMWIAENGEGSVASWKIQDPYDNLSGAPGYSNPNIVERAWHVYLAGLDSGFQYYGGEGNDDEVKTSLATRRAVEMLSSYVNQRKESLDNTPPTVLKPQRFPYNPGGYTFGWFNSIPGNNSALKKMRSEFYIWTHAYDVSGIANIVVKIRKDKDGSNPLATNQNETYAGGNEVESWVTIPMNKRVLPATAAALTAAANNSKISYFSQALSPEVADYYWAKVSEDTLSGFRGKLLDYYIEATDVRGKISKSEIQHVFVVDDGEGGPPPATVSFGSDPSDCSALTVTYTANQGTLAGVSPVVMWSRFADGGSFTAQTMATDSGVSSFTFESVPDNAPLLEVYFQNIEGTITDNRNGLNYATAIRDCDAPLGPVWTQPSPPEAGKIVTVFYDPEGRNLASASAINIHHGYNGGNWTEVPGEVMTESGNVWTYSYVVPAEANSVVMVFNNGSNLWDNNGGKDWTFEFGDPLAGDELRISEPASAVTVPAAQSTYTFTGLAGSLFTNGLTWTNLSSNIGGTVPYTGMEGQSGWAWTATVPLGPGANEVRFAADFNLASNDSPDDAAYGDGGAWINGSNGGSGFGPWSLSATSNAGHFRAAAGFGMYAFNGGRSTALRPFLAPLPVGAAVNVRFDNGSIAPGGSVGLALADANNVNRVSFFFRGGESKYRVTDAANDRDTGVGFTSNGLDLSFVLLTEDTYRLMVGGTEIEGTLAAGGAITQLVATNDNAGGGSESDFFLGAMSLTGQGEVEAGAPAITRQDGTPGGFPEWSGNEPMTPELLLKYAIGGATAPGEDTVAPHGSHDENTGEFVLTAIVREDLALSVVGKVTGDLSAGEWTTDGVTAVEPSDQSAAPVGCKVVEYRVSTQGGSRFLRLEVAHNSP